MIERFYSYDTHQKKEENDKNDKNRTGLSCFNAHT